jgi:hypothetical protein
MLWRHPRATEVKPASGKAQGENQTTEEERTMSDQTTLASQPGDQTQPRKDRALSELEMLLAMKTTEESLPPQPSAPPPEYCAICGDQARMITTERASALIRRSHRQLFRWIEDGSLHFVELADGSAMVCGRTLAAKLG